MATNANCVHKGLLSGFITKTGVSSELGIWPRGGWAYCWVQPRSQWACMATNANCEHKGLLSGFITKTSVSSELGIWHSESSNL